MTKTLLVNFEPPLAERLVHLLAARGHHVTIHAHGGLPLSEGLRMSEGFDLVLLDVSSDSAALREHLAALRNHRAKHGPRPMLLCVSRGYRGAYFELNLERKGARVAYVR